MSTHPPTLFILSYERPIYLWACLDSVYRNTKTATRIVLIDNGSKDPLVHRVIDGFSRRGLFDEVHRFEGNDCSWAEDFFSRQRSKLGEIFFYMDADVVIHESGGCWIHAMSRVMSENPRLAMLGSQIDRSDFEHPDKIQRRIGRALTPEEQDQIKLHSPERNMPEISRDEIASPFNPPGRLLALRTDPLHDLHGNFMKNDDTLHDVFRRHGWETGIYGGVVHRHLSLCNYFDYWDYSMSDRDRFFYG